MVCIYCLTIPVVYSLTLGHSIMQLLTSPIWKPLELAKCPSYKEVFFSRYPYLEVPHSAAPTKGGTPVPILYVVLTFVLSCR